MNDVTSDAGHTLLIVSLKVVTDEASLRHESRVSTGRNPRKSIKNPPLRHFACILRHNIAFLSVETRNSCLSEAASGTTLILTLYARTLSLTLTQKSLKQELQDKSTHKRYMGQLAHFVTNVNFFAWCLRVNPRKTH